MNFVMFVDLIEISFSNVSKNTLVVFGLAYTTSARVYLGVLPHVIE